MTEGTLLIEKDAVIMRSNPGTDEESVARLTEGQEVHVVRQNNGWLLVRTGDQVEGWIPQWFLDNPSLSTDQDLGVHVVFTSTLYSRPSNNSKELDTINPGTYLPINYESKGWIQLEYNGQVGYIQTENVDIIPIEEIPPEQTEETPETEASLEEQRAENEGVVVVRQANQSLLDEANLYANPIYTIELNQEFQYIQTEYDADGNEFYLVEDANGIRGYVESRVTAFKNDSIGHSGQPNVTDISEATIMIDAGHGGEDPGAVNEASGTYEKTATLQTSLYLKEDLEAYGANVLMTRSDDSTKSLENRSNMSNEEEADTFISIHYDAALDPSIYGTTTYFFHPNDYNLAESINNSLLNGPLPNNGISFGNYHVLRENQRPSILLELGYMSSTNDISYIQSDNYHQEIAQLIADGVNQYYQSLGN